MKKLLLVAVFGFAGTVSAKNKEQVIRNVNSEKNELSNMQKSKIYHWVEIVSPCGSVYYLAYESYVGCTLEELYADIATFNYAKCGETGFEYQGGYT